MADNRPFVFGVETSGDNFTDRREETERLLSNFKHGVNTVLISPRRWGKTSLVRKVCRLAESEDLKIVYLDIFSIRSEEAFYEAFATAVLKQTASKWEEWMEHIKMFLSRISPKISMGVDPMTDFSLSLELNPKDMEVEEILNLPEKIAEQKKCHIVICMDEFQQIAEFNHSKAFQKLLRSVWQLQKRVSYCLFGSKKHLMHELFEGKSRPFYQFGEILYLPKISTEDWVEYICGRFAATDKEISQDLAQEICRTADNHSSYVQQLAWLTWIHTDKIATEEDFRLACRDILEQNTPLFEKQTEHLTAYQMNFLRAIIDGVHDEFTTQKNLKRYNLSTSANVSTIKQALIKKEIIDIEQKKTVIPDPIMLLWLKQEFEKE